jgi:uncharacterized RDD family membrane protein YckC
VTQPPDAAGDPTAVLASRALAFAIDVGLVLVLVLLVFWRSHLPDYAHLDPDGPSGRACALVERTGDFAEVPDDAPTYLRRHGARYLVPADAHCLEVGSEVYLITGGQLRALRSMLWEVGLGVVIVDLVLLQAATAASLGKLLVGLRVVGADGRRAEPARCVARTLVLPVDVVCCGVVGAISVFTTRGHRRLGDLAAGTYVVHRSSVVRSEDEATDEEAADEPPAPLDLDLEPAVPEPPRPAHLPPPIPVDPEVLAEAEDGEGEGDAAGRVGTGPHDPPPLPEGEEGPAAAWDPATEAWVRYQPTARTWFRWDVPTQRWVVRTERRRDDRKRLH